MTICLASVNVDLKHTFLSISKALDCIGIDDINHGHRVGLIAYLCAKEMHWAEEECQMVFFCGLIHDCGVAHERDLRQLLKELNPRFVARHCKRGFALLSECTPLSRFAVPILHHHTPWEELKDLPISESDRRYAALVFLADRVDYLRALNNFDQYGNVDGAVRQFICDELDLHSQSLFNPEMVASMQLLIRREFVWFSLDESNIEQMADQFSYVDYFAKELSLDEIILVAEFLANIVDAKSQFTYLHSKKVAELSQYLAEQMSLSDEMQKALYLTGLVHDIGKLHTPEDILHKPGGLTPSEYLCIQRHVTDSYYSLRRMFVGEQICEWAGNHHERLDGSGYPRGLMADELDLPSRIVAVADVFQALTQVRPYRDRMSISDVYLFMDQEVEAGRLDVTVYQKLKDKREYCYQLSVSD